MHFMATFVAAFIIGFTMLWQLTLVILAIVPLMAGCGAVNAIAIMGVTSKGQHAYAQAGAVAEQAMGQAQLQSRPWGSSGSPRSLSRMARRRAARCSPPCSPLSSAACECSLAACECLCPSATVRSGPAALCRGYVLAGPVACISSARESLADATPLSAPLPPPSSLSPSPSLSLPSTLSHHLSVFPFPPLRHAMPNVTAFAKGQAVAHTIFHAIHHNPAMDTHVHVHGGDYDGDNTYSEASPPAIVKCALELHTMRFSYPARPDVAILDNFSLAVAAGTTVAIVGSPSSGKSTVVALVERFYDPLAGAVYMDRRDVRSLQLKWLREQIGLVSQEPALFATSIKENIMYGKDGSTMEEVEASAKVANTHEFIFRLPGGYDTQVGERGVQMSGGQKQRIAIARAILRNPAILLLDEATLALDVESEKVVQSALDKVMKGRTTVVIAHRLSMIRGAESIVVVTGERVVEQGTHEALMGKEGEYAALVTTAAVTMTTLPWTPSQRCAIHGPTRYKQAVLRWADPTAPHRPVGDAGESANDAADPPSNALK
ncbi:unnamed protein product [Closterium sp. NIES-54]